MFPFENEEYQTGCNHASAPTVSETYNVDPCSLTVSGFSSGAAFTMQFHVAFSRLIRGAGVISGCKRAVIKVFRPTYRSDGMTKNPFQFLMDAPVWAKFPNYGALETLVRQVIAYKKCLSSMNEGRFTTLTIYGTHPCSFTGGKWTTL